jgi:hypothetical protein
MGCSGDVNGRLAGCECRSGLQREKHRAFRCRCMCIKVYVVVLRQNMGLENEGLQP